MVLNFKHFLGTLGLLAISLQAQSQPDEDKSMRSAPVSRARSHRVTVVSTPNDPGHVTIQDHTAGTITRIDIKTGQVVSSLNIGGGAQG
jgi:hypothetical protein